MTFGWSDKYGHPSWLRTGMVVQKIRDFSVYNKAMRKSHSSSAASTANYSAAFPDESGIELVAAADMASPGATTAATKVAQVRCARVDAVSPSALHGTDSLIASTRSKLSLPLYSPFPSPSAHQARVDMVDTPHIVVSPPKFEVGICAGIQPVEVVFPCANMCTTTREHVNVGEIIAVDQDAGTAKVRLDPLNSNWDNSKYVGVEKTVNWKTLRYCGRSPHADKKFL
jgi:hypothetical protein